MDHIRTIVRWDAVDFLKVSGEIYENPGKHLADFLTTAASPSARQTILAVFADHALRTVTSVPAPLIFLTGGLVTCAQLETALSTPHAHLLGLGRSAAPRPDLPQLLRGPGAADEIFGIPPHLRVGDIVWGRSLPRIKLLGAAGVAMAWYIVALQCLARTTSIKPDYTVSVMGVVLWMWAWVGVF
ncbi:hypothetical protein C8R44DRAFT_728576 [Mycena epipterygia]|nr:hypothetical protein C8R44DRAFT_728576 [Mycena epipterygia]